MVKLPVAQKKTTRILSITRKGLIIIQKHRGFTAGRMKTASIMASIIYSMPTAGVNVWHMLLQMTLFMVHGNLAKSLCFQQPHQIQTIWLSLILKEKLILCTTTAHSPAAMATAAAHALQNCILMMTGTYCHLRKLLLE